MSQLETERDNAFFPTSAHRWAASAWKRLSLSAPADLQAVCDYLKIRVEKEVLPRDTLGCYVRTEDGIAMALINSGFSQPRQRFSLAHEIGHHLLLGRATGPIRIVCGVRRQTKEERLCNLFAVELLMPAALVREVAGDLGHPDIHDKTGTIAARFGVSLTAMRLRLNELDLSRHQL
jgi:Zn-dependent peptidase ImmA (M78 family)